MLSLRGWGAEEFRLADAELHEAAKWAIYAERVAPYVKDLERVMDVPMPADPIAKAVIATAKMEAATELPRMRDLLGLIDG